ncbi:hypothetical protein P154DRAFT_269807 [Amniculicola lignicola CBS 123094]|uniref:Uncharacterized protein n=1 Tax=Amniculicola lignicola CBS 123094 TaxID=1392246 RepID=A0A6A5W7I7_9PLEO|nr:hypothetical protein P154DRAFT_269807 [Amniculicola lignicola CBS 123094]
MRVLTGQSKSAKIPDPEVSHIPLSSKLIRGFFSKHNSGKASASGPKSKKEDIEKAYVNAQEPVEVHSIDQDLQSVPSVLGGRHVVEEAKVQIEKSKSVQKGTKGKLRFKWVVNDRDEFEACLELIIRSVQELRDLLTHYSNQPEFSNNGGRRAHTRSYKYNAFRRDSSPGPTSKHIRDSTIKSFVTPEVTLTPLREELYLCQETFHRLYSDVQPIMPEGLCVKLYYDHYSTWKEFRPYQGVNVRDSSIVFMFQAQLGKSSTENTLVIADAPILDSKDETPKDDAGVRRLMTQSIKRGPILDSLLKALDMDTKVDQYPFVCAGSVNLGLSYPFIVPEKALNSLNGKDASEQQDLSRVFKDYRISSDNHIGMTAEGSVHSYISKLVTEQHTKTKSRKKHGKGTSEPIIYKLFTKPLFHHIYQDRHCLWAQQTSLESLLRDSSFRKEEYSQAHLHLAVLLAVSSVSLGFNGKGRIIRPADCLYFRPSKELRNYVHEDMVMTPFLRLKPEPLVQVGNKSGIPPTKRQALVELGLLLYQIGSWKCIDYRHTEGVSAIVREAIADLDSVVGHLGNLFAGIVRNCLISQTLPCHFYIGIQPEHVDQWPRYGTEDDHQMVVNKVRRIQELAPRGISVGVDLQTAAPANEILEIWTQVVVPLKSGIQQMDVIDDERSCRITQTTLPSVRAIQDRDRRPQPYRARSVETLHTSEDEKLPRVYNDGINVTGKDEEGNIVEIG